MTAQEIATGADEAMAWMDAYMRVGFTRGEAMRLLSRPLVVIQPSTYQTTPEMSEALTKASLFYDRILGERDE